MTLSESIKAKAHALGFDLAGITTPDPPPHFDVYERWLAAGRHGEMDYLASQTARQRRSDPRLILPECRSILVLGVRYPAPPPHQLSSAKAASPAGESTGRVAAYAWGDDYHEVLKERLRAMIAFIEAQAGAAVPNRWYIDTGPLLERELAQRAGLGWIGKNTCLIAPGLGSYFFLAEVLLGIELEPDPPFLPDQCGSCTRCIEACPTDCILPDRTLDARRCISYLTIELKGEIPLELRPQMGEWVFGCDVCQQVCPWNNRFAAPHGDPAFDPLPGVASPDLPEALALTPQTFNRRFKRSPLRRAKRRGYLRNAATALGNQHPASPRAVNALAHALRDDPEALVRQHAAWALGKAGTPAARYALQAAWQSETDPHVRAEIQRWLNEETGSQAKSV